MLRIVTMSIGLGLGAALMACGTATPVRLVAGVHDTVIVNTTRAQAIPVGAFDRAGRTVAVPRFRVEWISGDSIALSPAGDVRCLRRGDSMIRIVAGVVSTRAALYCRPMRGFAFADHDYGLVLGGPSRALEVTGQGLDGRPVTVLAARIRVRDSAVAGVVDGVVVPRGVGSTAIDVEAGDDRIEYFVQVVRPASATAGLKPNDIFVTALALGPSDIRSYPITAGRYEIRFVPSAAASRPDIQFAVANANCARYADGEPHLSCVVSSEATLLVGRSANFSMRTSTIGKLVIRRLVETPSGRDYRFDAANYPLTHTSAR